MCGGTEAHGHFLDDTGHEESEDDEGKEEADAETGSSSGVGEHAGAIVFAEHDEDAGADEKPEEPRAGPQTPLCAGFEDAATVMGAINIFVGDDDATGGDGGGERV
jgi:hypothetical protein